MILEKALLESDLRYSMFMPWYSQLSMLYNALLRWAQQAAVLPERLLHSRGPGASNRVHPRMYRREIVLCSASKLRRLLMSRTRLGRRPLRVVRQDQQDLVEANPRHALDRPAWVSTGQWACRVCVFHKFKILQFLSNTNAGMFYICKFRKLK